MLSYFCFSFRPAESQTSGYAAHLESGTNLLHQLKASIMSLHYKPSTLAVTPTTNVYSQYILHFRLHRTTSYYQISLILFEIQEGLVHDFIRDSIVYSHGLCKYQLRGW